MKRKSPSHKFLPLLALITIISHVPVQAQDAPAAPAADDAAALAQRVADAYGVGAWNDVSEIIFTFNAVNKAGETSRSWRWEPQEDVVTFFKEGEPEPIRFFRSEVSRAEAKDLRELDRQFVNDSYWLLFPFHIVWAENLAFSMEKAVPAPISGEPLTKLTVQYPDEGGYTPGDAYDAYLGEDHMIREWVFRKGGQEKNTLAVTYDDHESFHDLVIALTRADGEGKSRVHFTNVEVKFETPEPEATILPLEE